MTDQSAWDRARLIGAVEEAETLGCALVGTEHLLLATLAEPTVRWAFRTVGVDRPDVQDEVTRIDRRRKRPRLELITQEAREALLQTRGIDEALDVEEPAGDPVARVLRLLAQRFLSRTRSTTARDVLDSLGVLAVRARVLATIEHNARAPQALPPRSTGAHRNTAVPDRRRTMTLLDHRPDPGPPAG